MEKGSGSTCPVFSSKTRAVSWGEDRGEGASPRAKGSLFFAVRPCSRPASSRPRPRRSTATTAAIFSSTSARARWDRSVWRMRSFTWDSAGTVSSLRESILMMWYPKSVFTSSETSPGFRLKAAFSKAGTMCPRPKQPRSPPIVAEPLSSDDILARAAKSLPAFTWARRPSAVLRASASGWPSPSGEALTFSRMWLAQTSSGSLNSSRCPS